MKRIVRDGLENLLSFAIADVESDVERFEPAERKAIDAAIEWLQKQGARVQFPAWECAPEPGEPTACIECHHLLEHGKCANGECPAFEVTPEPGEETRWKNDGW